MSKTGSVELLPSIARFPEEEPFYSHIYPSSLLERAHVDPQTFRNRAILTVRNDTVAEINNDILKRLNGSEEAFLSVNIAELDDETQDLPPPELLQTFNPSSLPPSRLCLKVGAPVILLRNLYPKDGLCNGTRMVITHLSRRCIQARILGSTFNS